MRRDAGEYAVRDLRMRAAVESADVGGGKKGAMSGVWKCSGAHYAGRIARSARGRTGGGFLPAVRHGNGTSGGAVHELRLRHSHGKSLATTLASPDAGVLNYAGKSDAPKQPVDYMAPQGSLALGIAYSTGFALVASLLWIGVAYLTGLAIGWIALAIGAAAGVGMQLGHKGYSKVGGMIAAGTTLFAIMVAKFAVLEIIIARSGKNISIFNLNPAKLGYYFFSPIGVIIILVGVAFAYRTANGSPAKW